MYQKPFSVLSVLILGFDYLEQANQTCTHSRASDSLGDNQSFSFILKDIYARCSSALSCSWGYLSETLRLHSQFYALMEHKLLHEQASKLSLNILWKEPSQEYFSSFNNSLRKLAELQLLVIMFFFHLSRKLPCFLCVCFLSSPCKTFFLLLPFL